MVEKLRKTWLLIIKISFVNFIVLIYIYNTNITISKIMNNEKELRTIWAQNDVRNVDVALLYAKANYSDLTDEDILNVWFDHYEVTGLEKENEELQLSLRAKIRVLESLPCINVHKDNIVIKSYVEYNTILDLIKELKSELKSISK